MTCSSLRCGRNQDNHGKRRTSKTDPAPEGAENQSRSAVLRHVCRDRRRAGSGALVFQGGRGGGNDFQIDFGLRHGRERRDLRQVQALRLARTAAGHAGLRARTEPGAAAVFAPREHRIFRLRQHRRGSQLSGHQRMPRLDGREISGAPAGRRQPDHHPRPNARPRKRVAAGGSGHRGRQFSLRCFFSASQAGTDARIAAR